MPTLIHNGEATNIKAITDIPGILGNNNSIAPALSPKALSELGRASAWAYACIIKRATMLSGVPLKLYKGKGDDRVEVEEHALLGNNGLGAGATQKLRLIEADLLVYGRAYLVWNTGITGAVFNLNRLNPQAVYPWRDSAGQLIGYEYRPNGIAAKNYRLDEVVVLANLDWANDYGGLSQMQVASLAAGADRATMVQVEAFFKNGALLSGMFTTDQMLQELDVERMTGALRRAYTGVKNFFKTFMSWGGLKFIPMQPEPRNLAMAELKETLREDICAVFGLSPALILTNAKYSNTVEARKAAYNETIMPECDYLADELNRQLVTRVFGADYQLGFDFSEIEALREDQLILYQRAQVALSSGARFGDVMEMMGLEAPEDQELADKRFIPTGLKELGAPEPPPAANPFAPAQAAENEPAEPDDAADDDMDETAELDAEQMKSRRAAALASVRLGQPVRLWGKQYTTPGDVRAAFEQHWPRPNQGAVLVDLLAELKAARAEFAQSKEGEK